MIGTATCERAITELKLQVTLRQTQKSKRLTHEVVGTGTATLPGSAGQIRSWSLALTSSGGPFVAGNAAADVAAVELPADALPAGATRTVKLGWERK